MHIATILLISREPAFIDTVRGVIAPLRHLRVQVVPEIDDAFPLLTQEEICLIVAHVRKGEDQAGVATLVRETAGQNCRLATLVVDDLNRPDEALELLRLGVADYLYRPLDLARFGFLVDMLTVRTRFRPVAEPARQSPGAAAPVKQAGPDGSFLYGSAEMESVVSQVQKVAGQKTNILLTGETGSGKTRLARLIHELSHNRDQPFLVVNCAALTTSLIESELFGHTRGSFTGADRDRVGKFCEVGGGTLLLDDVDTLPLSAQAKLLRAIDERVYEKVGSNRPLHVQARVITATNRSLEEEVAAGRFRADLFYRLNVLEFHVPPLRERRSDIASIAKHFLVEFASRSGRPIPILAPEVVRAFETYDWPGNIRELRNVIERCATLCNDDRIRFEELPHQLRRAVSGEAPVRHSPSGPSPSADPPGADRIHHNGFADRPEKAAQGESKVAKSVSMPHLSALANARVQAEVDRIVEALEAHNNNRQRAARELGISRVALYKKLHKYGLMDVDR